MTGISKFGPKNMTHFQFENRQIKLKVSYWLKIVKIRVEKSVFIWIRFSLISKERMSKNFWIKIMNSCHSGKLGKDAQRIAVFSFFSEKK